MKRMLGVLASVLACGAAQAVVELGTPFSDGMVLQRDRSVPVWGTNDASENGDWTFMHNASDYARRRLTVLVK